MTNDSGFAPNPFWQRLTLATCKPGIRRAKIKGDWIAGFTSAQLTGDAVGSERLVFLMKVSEKLTIAEYFLDKCFKQKIPPAACTTLRAADTRCDRGKSKKSYELMDAVRCCGDNIYRPIGSSASVPEQFEQLPNLSHWDGLDQSKTGPTKRRDISGSFVLVADEFAYFGNEVLLIPAAFRPEVPRGQSPNGSRTHDSHRADQFIDYVLTNAHGQRIMGRPSMWPEGDQSWRKHR
jgi:hypothetical protein